MVCFVAGIVATWMFMYGPIAVMQGFGSRALGGLDLSWLVGGLVAAGLYAVLGPRVYRNHQGGTPTADPVTSATDARRAP
jgi:nucleobase:cation symporter-1, NCS1 family